LSSNEKYLASSEGNIVTLWDFENRIKLETFTVGEETILGLAFSPDNKTLAISNRTNEIHMVSTNAGKKVFEQLAHLKQINSLSFSPDGHKLVTSSEDYTVKLWDVTQKGKLIATLTHEHVVYSASYSHSGKYIVTSALDNKIRIWDAETFQIIKTLSGHTDAVRKVVFSPDDQYVASSSSDKTVRIWNVKNGKNIKTLKGHTRTVNNVIFSPDGQRLATVSGDDSMRLWDIATSKQLAFISHPRLLARELTFSDNDNELLFIIGNNISVISLDSFFAINDEQYRTKWLNQQDDLLKRELQGSVLSYKAFPPNLYVSSQSSSPKWGPNNPFYWIGKANNGDSNAMYQLGLIHHRGRHFEQAKFWYKQALDNGENKAGDKLELLEKEGGGKN